MSILIKTPEQIEGIRRSCRLAAGALDWIEQFAKSGVTTEQINDEAESYIRGYGGYPAPLGYEGYPKAVCTSLNEVICHGIPSAKDVLKNGDILNVDVTTILDGYYGDTSRMYRIGAVCSEAESLLAVTADCLAIGISRVGPGIPFGEIGKAISAYARSRGCSVVHQFAGHGVGLAFHEEPQICHDDHSYDSRRMRPGMVFTVEPMICVGGPDALILNDGWTAVTLDGKLSAQYEHTVLVLETGVEVLTN